MQLTIAMLTMITLILAGSRSSALAQWVVEDYPLKAGWNSIWISADASYDTIDNLLSGTVSANYVNIEEVWRWNRVSSTSQFIQSPAEPAPADVQWLVWKRGRPLETTMTTFRANAAYLVKVADGASNFTLQLTGKPVPPRYAFASSGLNFFGFPMQTPDDTALRNFERFLSFSPALAGGVDVFYYDGENAPIPRRIIAPRFTAVRRGQAYWIGNAQFTDYYGPLRVTVEILGLDYGNTRPVANIRIKNITTQEITATIEPVASAAAPAGQPTVAGAVPLRLRGALDPQTGQFTYADLNGPVNAVLSPDQDAQLFFAVDRPAMGGNPGDVFQSILQVTDSLNISRVDLPVRAVTTSRTGLWIGIAVVSQVDQVSAVPDPQPDGTARVEVARDADAEAPSNFPLRLILHRDAGGTVRLLQQVYLGEDGNADLVLAATESNLDPSKLAKAKRFSSASFPLDGKFLGTGDLGLTGALTFWQANNQEIPLAYDATTNPFVHTYHPDHDNRDASASGILPEGEESWTVRRELTFTWESEAANLGLSSLNWGSTALGGAFEETITGLRAQPITVKGTFVINRISDIPTLTE